MSCYEQQIDKVCGISLISWDAEFYRYAVARGFVEAKAKVILVNRSWDMGSDAIRGIKKDFGVEAQVEWYHCDLGNLKETREVFMGIREREKRLDLVCCRCIFIP